MVPTAAEPPAIPFTDQETAVLAVPTTDALNALVVVSGTLAEAGATVTVTTGTVTFTETVFPVTEPLPGCRTEKTSVPACGALPLTLIWVGET